MRRCIVLFVALLWFKVIRHRQRRFDASFNQISSDLSRPLFPHRPTPGATRWVSHCQGLRFGRPLFWLPFSSFACLGFGLFILAAGCFLPSYFSLNKIVFIRFDRCLNLTASSCLFNMFKNKRRLPPPFPLGVFLYYLYA